MELFALLHDGNFHGDSSFYFPGEPVPYKEGMTLDDVRKSFLELMSKKLVESGLSVHEVTSEIENYKEDITAYSIGAIIVTKKVVEAMEAIWESDPGNDSAVYACNRAAKRVGWMLKESHIGEGMQ